MHQKGKKATKETKEKMSQLLMGHKRNHMLSEEQVKLVKELRNQGYTHREIGEIIGIHHSSITKILNGKTYKQYS